MNERSIAVVSIFVTRNLYFGRRRKSFVVDSRLYRKRQISGPFPFIQLHGYFNDTKQLRLVERILTLSRQILMYVSDS
jgi:hypothetical protein